MSRLLTDEAGEELRAAADRVSRSVSKAALRELSGPIKRVQAALRAGDTSVASDEATGIDVGEVLRKARGRLAGFSREAALTGAALIREPSKSVWARGVAFPDEVDRFQPALIAASADRNFRATVRPRLLKLIRDAGIEDAERSLKGEHVFTHGGESLVLKALDPEELAKNINKFLGGEIRRVVDVASNATGTRVAAFGMLHEARVLGISIYRVDATLDSSTTDFCVAEGTKLTPVGDLIAAYRRKYVGKMITIATAAGKELMVTPNHPVLTARGWLAAGEIEEGDQVVNAADIDIGRIDVDRDVAVEADCGRIFDSLSEPSVLDVKSTRSSEADFHGDGMGEDYEIDVASVDGVLGDWVESVLDECVKDALLTGVHLASYLPADGRSARLRVADLKSRVASQGGASFSHDAVEPALASAELGHNLGGRGPVGKHGEGLLGIGVTGGGAGSSRNVDQYPGLAQESRNSADGDSVVSGNSVGGFPGGVHLDDVVLVTCEDEFRGHVYNLSCCSEYYIANGILVHNCNAIHGREFRVEQAFQRIRKVMRLTNPDDVKGQNPFPAQSLSSEVPTLGADALQEMGFDVPPFHFLCRTVVTPVSREAVPQDSGPDLSEWLVDGDQFLEQAGRVYGPLRQAAFRDLRVAEVMSRAGMKVPDSPKGDQLRLFLVESQDLPGVDEVRHYTTGAHERMNGALRGVGAPPMTSDDVKSIETLDSLFESASVPETIFAKRGVPTFVGDKLEDASATGTTFADRGFSSTTLKGSTDFGEDEMSIRVPEGSRGLFVKDVSEFRNEEELLLPRSSAFRVLSVEPNPNGKGRLFKVEYVGQVEAQAVEDVGNVAPPEVENVRFIALGG